MFQHQLTLLHILFSCPLSPLTKFLLFGIFSGCKFSKHGRNSSIRKQLVDSVHYSDDECSVLAVDDFLSDGGVLCDGSCSETLRCTLSSSLAQSCFNQYANTYLNRRADYSCFYFLFFFFSKGSLGTD